MQLQQQTFVTSVPSHVPMYSSAPHSNLPPFSLFSSHTEIPVWTASTSTAINWQKAFLQLSRTWHHHHSDCNRQHLLIFSPTGKVDLTNIQNLMLSCATKGWHTQILRTDLMNNALNFYSTRHLQLSKGKFPLNDIFDSEKKENAFQFCELPTQYKYRCEDATFCSYGGNVMNDWRLTDRKTERNVINHGCLSMITS
jgi:hypothetical protein